MNCNIHRSTKDGYRLVVFHDARKNGIVFDAALEIQQIGSERLFVQDLENNYDKYLLQAETNKKGATLLRELAYNTERTIPFDGETLTVTEAAQLWQYYAAESSEKADEISDLIIAAKEKIRSKYPD